MFNSLDDYYKLFNNKYLRYYIRGDPTREMSMDNYLDNVIPYIKILIDQKKNT